MVMAEIKAKRDVKVLIVTAQEVLFLQAAI